MTEKLVAFGALALLQTLCLFLVRSLPTEDCVQLAPSSRGQFFLCVLNEIASNF